MIFADKGDDDGDDDDDTWRWWAGLCRRKECAPSPWPGPAWAAAGARRGRGAPGGTSCYLLTYFSSWHFHFLFVTFDSLWNTFTFFQPLQLYWLSSTTGPPLTSTFLVITFTFKRCVELSGNNFFEINDLKCGDNTFHIFPESCSHFHLALLTSWWSETNQNDINTCMSSVCW